MKRKDKMQQPFKIMDFWNRLAGFFQKSLEIFFRRLLAVKANLVMQPIRTVLQIDGCQVIVFGFLYPRASFFPHTEPFPSSRSPYEMNPSTGAARLFSEGCGQSGPWGRGRRWRGGF